MFRFLAGLGLCSALLLGLEDVGRANAQDDQKFFDKVMNQLLSTDLVRREYPDKYSFPPKFFIKPSSEQELNAYASSHERHGATFDPDQRKIRPVVMVTQGYLHKVIKGDEAILAAIMGHEIAHLTKEHIENRAKAETALLFVAFTREQEIEADLEGMRYAVAAGFPYKGGIASAIREMKTLPGFTSFEGLKGTHPSWEERLAFLDREQPKLWSSMAAFSNGATFLHLEQYAAAEQCFRGVIKEFPDCYEAWANLGCALLMQYCDALEVDDLRRFGVGHIVAGCFYERPGSLDEKVRGIDEKLWKEAVKTLQRSLSLKSDLVLPRACLGLAYLVHPAGSDGKEAARWFGEALVHFKNDPGAKNDRLSLAALLTNSGVADLAAGNLRDAENKFVTANGIVTKMKLTNMVASIEDAILFNLGLVDSAGDPGKKKQALKEFQVYLNQGTPSSAWWKLAYSRYADLGKDLGLAVPAKEVVLKSRGQVDRVVTSITVGDKSLFLSEPMDDALGLLGRQTAVQVPLYPGAKIVRWRFPDKGIDVLGKEKVLAIFLNKPAAPPIKLQGQGLGAQGRELRVGMSEADAQEALQKNRPDNSQQLLTTKNQGYKFYPELGLAVRVQEGRIVEIALAQIPRFGK